MDFFESLNRLEIRDDLRTNGNRPMHSYQILRLFDLPPTSPIPVDYSAERTIGNVRVTIVPRGAGPINRRVIAYCPKCDKPVCAGHLHQHMKVHNDKRGRI